MSVIVNKWKPVLHRLVLPINISEGWDKLHQTMMQIITSCDIYYENKVQFHMRIKWGVGPFTYLLILIILFLYCHTFIHEEIETVFKLINFSKLTQFQSGRARHTGLLSRLFCLILLDLLITCIADSFTDGMTWLILPCSMKPI